MLWKFTLPLAALLATATARPYDPIEEAELLARFAEADRLASAANIPNPLHAQPTAAPRDTYNEPRTPSDQVLDFLPRRDFGNTSPASYFPPWFDPYNPPSPEEDPSEFNYGASPIRDGAKYNGPYTYASHYCWGPFGWAKNGDIKKGINYLYKVEGQPRNSPRSCGRATYPLSLESYGNIAQAALFITEACFKYKNVDTRTAGQVFFKEKWSAYITFTADKDC
ncbi:hypothetical protein B0T20DRAFT_477016 [Sordaria brevicollis]|uniref:Uncharacterized protein n=1 Tax=Sordaria brevicollis TaxID=83679 RepID=A0AAE0PJD6_SORBR|nr:hypothetical protein B0T20DRAFT_477016 [Sordaria brevicollis]